MCRAAGVAVVGWHCPIPPKLGSQIVGELRDDRRRRHLDDADAAAILRHRAGQRQIRVHQNFGAHFRCTAGGLEAETAATALAAPRPLASVPCATTRAV